MSTELQRLGLLYDTDKSRPTHTFHGMTYMDVYSQYFSGILFGPHHVLEIGVLEGASLKVWRDYFPTAEVWGVDIDPARNVDRGPGIHIITGSQADPATLAQVAPGSPLDIVIDDGSHLVDHIMASFELLWPRVRSGGLYCIEDLSCTYGDLSGVVNCWPGQHLNPPGTNFVNNRVKFEHFLLDHVFHMDTLSGDMRSIHFWPMQIIIRKV